uniref:Putative ovule protein n=1 Tax=Solanum chacoense TaxID=4108 RepID=A0A0V0IH47_SOLCH
MRKLFSFTPSKLIRPSATAASPQRESYRSGKVRPGKWTYIFSSIRCLVSLVGSLSKDPSMPKPWESLSFIIL